MKERHVKLLDYLTKHGKTDVAALAEIMGISAVTARKDLDELEEKCLIIRERGYALPGSPDDIRYRMAYSYREKQNIARAAAELIADGETLFIEAGSTCALFAEEVARTKENVTIITNSTYLCRYIEGCPGARIVLLGGELQSHSQTLIGSLTKAGAAKYHTDKIFVGTDGYSHEFGFTGDDLARADTLESLVMSADHVYVLTTSDKLKKPGAVSFLPLEKVYALVTDKNIPADEKKYLEGRKIKVITA